MTETRDISKLETTGSTMMNRALVIACVFAFAAQPSSLAAQSPPPALELDTTAICMAGAFGNVPQVSQARRGQAFRIVVAAHDVPALEARGFAQVECTVADLATADKRRNWRNEICEFAAFGNEAVQNQLERAYGARPAQLCGSAKLAVGDD